MPEEKNCGSSRRKDGELAASIERGRQFTLSDTQKRAEEPERQATDIENASAGTRHKRA